MTIREKEIEQKLIDKLRDLKYTYVDDVIVCIGFFSHPYDFGKIDLKFDHIPEPLIPNIDFSIIKDS